MPLITQPITEANRNRAIRLSVLPEQEGFVETVEACLKEADELPAWKPVCICDGPEVVGFAMYGYIQENSCSRVWFDRFLIDRNYQGQGYGKRAIAVILQQIRREYPGRNIYLSVYEENKHAISLYQAYGFRRTGELDTNGEKVMVLQADQRIVVQDTRYEEGMQK